MSDMQTGALGGAIGTWLGFGLVWLTWNYWEMRRKLEEQTELARWWKREFESLKAHKEADRAQ